MDRRAAGALLALAACIASSAAAPTVSNQTAIDLYDAASEGCYYNFQHYGEGDRIMTNEPCLNCTCHNRMLMCYLRVCPFTKPIGQDCTVEKRADQCCPIVTCPDVPVDLLTSTSTSSPAEYGATGLGKLDKYGCSINGKYFPEGSKVPPTPNKPCEHCYCIRNMTTCVMQECTLHVDGCTPIYHKDVCCPVRYSCDHPEDEMPLLDDMSTTVRPTPGFLLTTTTLSPVTQMTQDCVHNDQIFPDGTSIKTEKACEHCYCMKGDIVCVVQECGTPMENEGKNCTSVAPRAGQCCPDTYICEGDEVTTELMLDYTTEPSIEKLTTLVPPRRVLDEGSGYRKEEEPIATELPAVEPEVEGSGEEFATIQPSDETERETPSLIDESISSTEDVIGKDTTPQFDTKVEKATTEPDSELNTVPSGTVEPSETSVLKLTTVSDDKTSEETEQPHADGKHTTASLETKDEEIPAQTTEQAFRKEDESLVPFEITTAKEPEYYTTTELQPTKFTKEEGIHITEEPEPLATVSESKLSTPASSEDGQTELATEISITTARDELTSEPTVAAHDHTVSETPTTVVTEKSETTSLNAQENEIEDVSTTQGPGRIPGEGDCLQNGITYRNESTVPSMNNCQTDCKCVSSIIKCDPIICSGPPEYMSNCVPTYDSLESCCPTYVCDGSKETLPPQPHSQMSETSSSTPTPAIDCEGDQCDVTDKSPEIAPGDIPETSDCGSEGCKDILQTPVQIDVQPECASEDCGGENKPELHEKPSTVSQDAAEICTGGECQPKPIEKEDSLQPCEGENCNILPSQPCKNEEECKNVHVPDVKLPCEGELCKSEPTNCGDEDCKLPPKSSPVSNTTCEGENCKVFPVETCQNGEDCKTVKVPKTELPCKGDSCKIEPAECSDDGCKMPTETSPVEPVCEGDNCKISTIEPPKVELPCEGESCKVEPTECKDEGCKIPTETSPVPICEGENCKIYPTEPCQNEDECNIINFPKNELPCEGESCKLEPATETVPMQSSCEGGSCGSKVEEELECSDEECKKKITPDVTGELPSQCNDADCISESTELPEKTEISVTESPLPTQDKETEIPSVTTKYLDSTKPSEFMDTETTQTSVALGEATTDKSVKVTELDETQTESSTDYPERKTTVIKYTTPGSDLEVKTESKHEFEVTTIPSTVQGITNKEAEGSQSTEFDNSVTNKPEPQESSKPSEENEVVTEEAKLPEKQETSTIKEQEKDTQTTELSDTKSEIGTTETVIRETAAQPEKESSPESTVQPDISTVSLLDEQYTMVSKLGDEKEATTESVVKHTEQIASDDEKQVSQTEMSTRQNEETSITPIESPAIDEKISTIPSEVFEISTEESRTVTPVTPDSVNIPSDGGDELPSKKTEIPDLGIQEPMQQTTSIPEPPVDYQEPGKQDGETTAKFDLETSTSQPSIIHETDTSYTEKPLDDKEKIPDLPSEEVFTESPEINTEEPSLITHSDDGVPPETIEPESPYIPVHPTVPNKLEPDLSDKEVTPEISPEIISSTEFNLHSSTPESILESQTQESVIESVAPEKEYDTKTTLSENTEQYEHDMRVTDPSVEISPTDTRRFNKDGTESPEPITTVDAITTSYPTEEKQSESSVYSEPSTSKPTQEKEQFTTVPEEIFNTEKQELMTSEVPESHVKETESEMKVSTAMETATTEKIKPIESQEPQTPSPPIAIEPTESQSPDKPVDEEKEKPEEESEKATAKTPEYTSQTQFEYSETTPDMIELVEHNEMLDISTLPTSISDERSTIGPITEKSDENLTTQKLVTPVIESETDKVTTTSVPLSEDTEHKTSDEITTTKSDLMKDHETMPAQQEDIDSHKEVKPDIDISTLKPDIDETKLEYIPVQETTTEIVQIDQDQSTEHIDITNLEQVTEQPEDVVTEKPEISDSDIDQLTTRKPEEPVTDFKTIPEEVLATEEPGSGEIETKPDEDYLTEKPEIEQESTPMISKQPSIDEEPVTAKSKEATQSEVQTSDNGIIPEKEKVEPTVPSISETEIITEKDMVTYEPEYSGTKPADLGPLEEGLVTEIPMAPEIIQEPEIESTSDHKILPDEDFSTSGSEIPVTEKETQELTTKKPKSESPESPSTKLPESAVPEEDNQLQPSTAQPELVAPEQGMTTEKEFVSGLPVTSDIDQVTKAPGSKDEQETPTISPEKEKSTDKPEVDESTETPTKAPESSDIEKQSEHEATTLLPESEEKLPSREITTEQPVPSIEQETISEIEPTERVTISESQSITEEQDSVTKETLHISTTVIPITTESEIKPSEESSTEDQATISLETEAQSAKPDVFEEQIVPELSTKVPEMSKTLIPEYVTEPQKRFTTDKPEISIVEHEATTEPVLVDEQPSVTEHGITLEEESDTKVPQAPEEPSSEHPVHEYETTVKTTNIPFVENLDDKETSTLKPEYIDDYEKLSTSGELSSTLSSTEQEVPEKATEASPESHGETHKQDEELTKYTTPGYSMKDETTASVSETEKSTVSEEGLPVQIQPETEKPIDSDLTKDTTAPEEEFLTVTTKATTPKAETEAPIHSEDIEKTSKPQETQEETSSTLAPEVPKPGLNDVQATNEVPVPEEEGHFPPSATGGYGQEPDYEDENQPFGPGTCRYGGKVYVSAQQIPRDDPCDFCFCFRSDIICLQQSCPPPIHGCHEEPIQGFCCPRYECPVSMASTLNITTTTTTTTTTLPPHFLPHAYQGAVQRRGCQIKGHTYKVGEVVRASSGPCLHCTCGGDGQMKCDPKACTPEPMLRQMIAAAVSAKRRR